MVGKCVLVVAFVATVFSQLPVATIPTADRKGSKDSPVLKRYEGSFIVAYEHKSFGELTLPLSRLEAVPGKKTQQNNTVHEPTNKKALEGRLYTNRLPHSRRPIPARGPAQLPGRHQEQGRNDTLRMQGRGMRRRSRAQQRRRRRKHEPCHVSLRA